MRHLVLSIGAILLLVFSPLSPAMAGPRYDVGRSSIQFAPVPEGRSVEKTFTVKNTGDAELRILKVAPG